MTGLPSLPKLPTPAEVLAKLPIKELLAQMTGNIPAGFHPKDVGEIRVTFGDVDENGKLDVRVRLFAKIPVIGKEPEPRFLMGPYNVHIDEAIQGGAVLVAALPAPAAGPAGVLLLEAGTLVGAAEKFLLE